MRDRIPPSHVDLFSGTPFAALATLDRDGRPSVSICWCDYDGEYVLLAGVRDHPQAANLARDARVGLAVFDPGNPYRYVEIEGHAIDMSEDGAEQHIDALARKYLGQDRYPFRVPGEIRIIVRIAIDRVAEHG